MKTNKIIILTGLFFGLIITQCSVRSMNTSKEFFFKSCRLLNYGLSGAIGGVSIYSHFYRINYAKKLEDVDLKVAKIIREELSQVGIQNPELINIKKSNEKDKFIFTYTALTPNCIVIPADIHKLILTHLELKKDLDELEFQGVIQHEAVHMKYYDMYSRELFAISMPIVMHIIYKKLGLFFNFSPLKSYERIFCENLGAGLLKNILHQKLYYIYARYVEQRADDEVVKPKELYAFLKKHYDKNGDNINDISHPQLSSRVKKLEERIKSAEENQDN